MNARNAVLALLGSAFFAAPSFAEKRILFVDATGGPGADFTDLPQAVAAAQPDDVLLVKAGTYSGFTVDGKSVHMTGEDATKWSVAGQVVIQNVPDGATVFLSGMDVSSTGFGAAVLIRDSSGSIYLEKSISRTGLLAQSAGPVVLTNCSIRGAFYFNEGMVLEDNSFVSLYESSVTGSTGSSNSEGTTGAELTGDSVLFASGSSIIAGDGGDGADPRQYGCDGDNGGDGGVGLCADFGTAYLLDSAVYGGRGGAPYFDCCFECYSGYDGDPYSGNVHFLSADAFELNRDLPVYQNGDTATIVLEGGQDGDRAFLVAHSNLAPRFLLQRLMGTAMFVAPPVLIPLGTRPPGSFWTVDLPLGRPCDQGNVFFAQALILTQNGRQLSNPVSLLLRR